MDDITIQKAKELKNDAELKIMHILYAYQKESGLSIKNISATFEEGFRTSVPLLISVSIKVEL